MSRRAIPIALVSIEGTNCDDELAVALRELGARPEIVHLKQLMRSEVPKADRRRLADYAMLFFPGGFSAGDYVRAGAIFAARARTAIGPELEEFVRSGKIVGGLCNGFQVLTELGLLPGRADGRLGPPEAALITNDSNRYECRPTYLAWDGGRFPALASWPKGERLMVPSGHGEGKLVLAGAPGERLLALERDGQILFRYVAPDGSEAHYPWNPNGSEGNVAGITNPAGNVFGLMPHPERSFFRSQHPDWTRTGSAEGLGDGARFLGAVLDHAARLH